MPSTEKSRWWRVWRVTIVFYTWIILVISTPFFPKYSLTWIISPKLRIFKFQANMCKSSPSHTLSVLPLQYIHPPHDDPKKIRKNNKGPTDSVLVFVHAGMSQSAWIGWEPKKIVANDDCLLLLEYPSGNSHIPYQGTLENDFTFTRWDMLVPWRVIIP